MKLTIRQMQALAALPEDLAPIDLLIQQAAIVTKRTPEQAALLPLPELMQLLGNLQEGHDSHMPPFVAEFAVGDTTFCIENKPSQIPAGQYADVMGAWKRAGDQLLPNLHKIIARLAVPKGQPYTPARLPEIEEQLLECEYDIAIGAASFFLLSTKSLSELTKMFLAAKKQGQLIRTHLVQPRATGNAWKLTGGWAFCFRLRMAIRFAYGRLLKRRLARL